jgi:cytochrome P450
MWYASGNRDETVFERPDDLWIDRPNPRRHLSFGYGIHRCVGMRVGEMQLRIVWEELLKRFGHVEVVEPPSRLPNCFVKGYDRMMVVLHPK